MADDAVVDDFDLAADRRGLTVIGYLEPVPEWIGSTRLAMMPLQLDAAPIPLSVALDNPGRVTSVPAAIDCPTDCSAAFVQEQTVVLTAAPVAGGGNFIGWAGSAALFGAPGTATMATLTLTVNGGGHVSAGDRPRRPRPDRPAGAVRPAW